MFHVCFNLCVVYGVGICVYVCGVVCVICFLRLDVFIVLLVVLLSSVVGIWGVVIFVLSVMRVPFMGRVEPITTFMRGGRLRWYGHKIRTGRRNVWSIELKAEDRLEDQERHGYRV